MGLLSRAENVNDLADRTGGDASQPALRKVEVSETNLNSLKNRISEYQRVYRVFGCILFKNKTNDNGKADLCEKLAEMLGEIGITGSINHDLALILIPTEMDRELIAHRFSKSLNVEPVLSFRAVNPDYVINRISSMSWA